MKIPRLCNFARPNGSLCRDVAIGRSRLCRNHHRQAAQDHRRSLALNPGRTVRLGPLETRPGILYALNRVMQLVADGTLPRHRARRALSHIRRALAELNRDKAMELEAACIPDVSPALSSAGPHLPSPPMRPTIEQSPRQSALSTCSSQSVASFEQSTPTRIQNRPLATGNAQRRTDNASQ